MQQRRHHKTTPNARDTAQEVCRHQRQTSEIGPAHCSYKTQTKTRTSGEPLRVGELHIGVLCLEPVLDGIVGTHLDGALRDDLRDRRQVALQRCRAQVLGKEQGGKLPRQIRRWGINAG